jgi:hypothetical protein
MTKTFIERFDENLGRRLAIWANEKSDFHQDNPPQLKGAIIRGAIEAFLADTLEELGKECVGEEEVEDRLDSWWEEGYNTKRQDIIEVFKKWGILL